MGMTNSFASFTIKLSRNFKFHEYSFNYKIIPSKVEREMMSRILCLKLLNHFANNMKLMFLISMLITLELEVDLVVKMKNL
jgi:hypothetical protein